MKPERAGKGNLQSLTGSDLISLIEEAQRLLDEQHPLNPKDLKCPTCGSIGPFRLEVYQWADYESGSVEIDLWTDSAWGAESACNCPECDYSGRVIDYLTKD